MSERFFVVFQTVVVVFAVFKGNLDTVAPQVTNFYTFIGFFDDPSATHGRSTVKPPDTRNPARVDDSTRRSSTVIAAAELVAARERD
ncbi:MAG: hypothetical protein AAF229_11445 [Pseudomonadota bacterium]